MPRRSSLARLQDKIEAAIDCLDQILRRDTLVQGAPLVGVDPQVISAIREDVLREVAALIRRFLAENYRSSKLQVRSGVLWESSVEQIQVTYDPDRRCILITPGPQRYPGKKGHERLLININVKRWGAVYRSGLGATTKQLAKAELFKGLRRRTGKPKSVPVPGGGRAVPPFPPFWQLLPNQLSEIERLQKRIIQQGLRARTQREVAGYAQPLRLRVA